MTTAQQMRQFTGPAVLSYGFRPFFLLGPLWAAIAMVMWIFMLMGTASLPSRFDPTSWHAHEFLFGYLSAIIAGFLLTAVPNWTGRLPVVGWPLGGLVLLWLLGRVAVATSLHLPSILVAGLDLSFPVVLGGMILREIIAGKNWRNLIVLAMLAAFTTANLIFHIEAAQGLYAAHGFGLRFGIAAGLMMISVIGGRIIPSFTRNWLVKQGHDARPAPPMQTFDKIVLLATLIGLIIWVIWPDSMATGGAMIVLSGLHLSRLIRWKGHLTMSEPLVWVLHAGYLFIPLGALAVGADILMSGEFSGTGAQHLWMAGAIGMMTLAVMTRATLGHTGQALHSDPITTALYVALIGSVFLRYSAGLFPAQAMPLYHLSATLWIVTFAGFSLSYGRLLLLPKPQKT